MVLLAMTDEETTTIVTVTKKGQATIPKSMRERHKIGRKALVLDTAQGILVRPVPDPSSEKGSLKKYFKDKTSQEIIDEARLVDKRLEERRRIRRNQAVS